MTIHTEFDNGERSSVSLWLDGEARIISGPKDEMEYLRELLRTGADDEEIRAQLNKLERLNQKLRRAEVEATDDYDEDDDVVHIEGPIDVKIHEDGRVTVNETEIDSSLTDKIIELLENSKDATPLIRFLERIVRNPSDNSRRQAYDWLVNHDFQITQDGLIIGYKGVTREGSSVHTGREEVTIEYPDTSKKTTVVGRVPNQIGSIISMNRNLVDDNPSAACSRGLHVGTHGYANSYGQVLRVVLVDPADICSVPSDGGGRKIRVCRYQVVGDAAGNKIDTEDNPFVPTSGLQNSDGDVRFWKQVGWDHVENDNPRW